MTIDINQLEMCSSLTFYLFYLWCASRLSGIVIALGHTFGHPLYIIHKVAPRDYCYTIQI